MIRRECHVPTQRIVINLGQHCTCVVEQAVNRQLERDNFRSRTSHTYGIRQITNHRHRGLPQSFNDFMCLFEFSGIASYQNDRTVLGKLKRGGMTYTRGRPGDDVRVAYGAIL